MHAQTHVAGEPKLGIGHGACPEPEFIRPWKDFVREGQTRRVSSRDVIWFVVRGPKKPPETSRPLAG